VTDDRRRTLDAILASLEAACDLVDEPWGTLVSNPEFRRVHMANFLWLRSLPPGGVEEALLRTDEVFAPLRIRYRQLFVEDPALANRIAPDLERRGFSRKSEHLMVARDPPALAANPKVSLRPARDASTWDDHDAVSGLIHEEEGYDHEVSYQLLGLHRRRQARLSSEVFVAYLRGEPVGNVAIDGIGGTAEVYELETAPTHRHNRVAATMVLAMRARAEARGLAPVFLRTTVGHTTWQMYEKLGFAREGTLEGFLQIADASTPRETVRGSSPQ